MSKAEFVSVMAYLAVGTSKELSPSAAQVYFDLLGDLPAEVLRAAAQQALLESQYPTFPPVGVLRRLASEIIQGRANVLTAPEAWGLLRRALAQYGYFREAQGLAALPPVVRRAAQCMGWRVLCDSTEPEIIRAQFCKTFEAVAGREQRERLLPGPLREAMDRLATPPELVGPPDARNAWQVLREAGVDLAKVGRVAEKNNGRN